MHHMINRYMSYHIRQGAIPIEQKNAPKLTGFPGDFTEFTVPSGGQNI